MDITPEALEQEFSLTTAVTRLDFLARRDSGETTLNTVEDVDAGFLEVTVERPELLLGDLRLLERGRDVLDGQEAALLALGDQCPQLVDLGDRRLVSQ